MLVLVSYDVATTDKAVKKGCAASPRLAKTTGSASSIPCLNAWSILPNGLCCATDFWRRSTRKKTACDSISSAPTGSGASNTSAPKKITTKKDF